MKKGLQIFLIALLFILGIFDVCLNKPIGYTNYIDYINLRWLQYVSLVIIILILLIVVFEKTAESNSNKSMSYLKRIGLILEGFILCFFSIIDRTIFYKEGFNEFYSSYNIILPIASLVIVVLILFFYYFFENKARK